MGLREDIMNETVDQLPLRRAVTVTPQTSTAQAIQLMRESKLGCVFVADEQGRPTGKFTERQVLKLICDCVPLDEPVSKHVVPIPQCGFVKMTDPIVKVLHGMLQTRLRFVCVIDDAGKVIALAGQKGLMEYITEHFPRQIKVQMMTSKLHMNTREGA
jgi:CBS domain-containing protein